MNEPLKPGALLSGRYSILAQIGEGGFGTIYKARDEHKYGQLVALKEINMAALSTQEKIDVTDSFNREITLLSHLNHKNLPHIYDQFTDPEHWYIVMDYIEGQTLEDLLARSPKGRLSVVQTVRICMALCDVLSYLHNQNPPIIFRDVKPGNIMLTFWGQLYLIDFGIARRYRKGQIRDTGSLGSPGYAAPEQYGRMQTTPQTDIYGLGITLQTLLTGKEPLEIRLQGTPPDVHTPRKLQTLINKMIDPDPSKRPHSMAEVKQSLPHYVTSRWSWFFIVQFGFASMTQSGFGNTPFAEPYSWLVLTSMVAYCIFMAVRSWQTAPAGLSAKATALIMGKEFLFSLIPISVLTLCISVLYALLAQPQLSVWNICSLWIYSISSILVALIFLITWLKEKYVWPPQQAPKQPQAAPLQQQTQRHP